MLKANERRHHAFARVCHYILQNPLEAGFVQHALDWSFCGALIPGYPTLHPLQGDFWGIFWKRYADVRAPDAGNLIRPPLSSS